MSASSRLESRYRRCRAVWKRLQGPRLLETATFARTTGRLTRYDIATVSYVGRPAFLEAIIECKFLPLSVRVKVELSQE